MTRAHISIAAWQELAEHAVEFNPFFEPWFFESHQATINSSQPSEVLPVEADGRLVALAHLEEDSRAPWRLLPGKALRLVRSPYIYFGAPLVRTGYVANFVQAIRDLFEGDKELQALSLGPLYTSSQLADEIGRHAALLHMPCLTWRNTRRPYFSSALPPSDYLPLRLSRKHEKDLAKKASKLGPLVKLNPADPNVIERFLALEGGGWKGANNSSLAAQSITRDFFSRIVTDGAGANRASVASLGGNDSPVMKVIFSNGKKDFSFKVGFDESLAALSPGTVLSSHLINDRLAAPLRREADSCAAPEAMPFARLWKTSRTLGEITLLRTGFPSSATVKTFTALRSLLGKN